MNYSFRLPGGLWALSSMPGSASHSSTEGTQYPGPGTWVPGARAPTHSPQGGQVATPDGEPHRKETHRLADASGSGARGECMNFQLA